MSTQAQKPGAEMVPAGRVAGRYNRSLVTLWRWENDPNLGFPKPVYIRRQRYWRLSELLEWERKQAA